MTNYNENTSYFVKLSTLIIKMWDNNVTDLNESCNEEYANTPVQILREIYLKHFKTSTIGIFDEELSKLVLLEFNHQLEQEIGAWESTSNLMFALKVHK